MLTFQRRATAARKNALCAHTKRGIHRVEKNLKRKTNEWNYLFYPRGDEVENWCS